MFEEKDLANLFGKADDSFNENFNSTMAKLKTTCNRRRSVRMSTKAITLIVVICIIALTGTAYAISQFTMQFVGNKETVDSGGGFFIVAVTESQWEEETQFGSLGVYIASAPSERQPRFDTEMAEALRLLLMNEVFAEGGEVFDFFVLDRNTGSYFIDDRGNALYNEAGEELAEIYYEPEDFKYNGKPVELWLLTKTDREEQRQRELAGDGYTKLTYDYNEAVQHMGGYNFRLPAVYTERLDLSMIQFRIQKPIPIEYYQPGMELNGEAHYDPRGVTVYVSIDGHPGLYYWAEAPRDEEIRPMTDWTVGVDRIEEWLISETDTTVYKLISNDGIRYTWKHDNIVYMLFNGFILPDQFSDEQFMEIIFSMVT